MAGASAHIDLHGNCPYCEYRFVARANDVRGQLVGVRCVDCKQLFLVEIAVVVDLKSVHRLAGVDVDRVLDELAKVPHGPTKSHAPGLAQSPAAAQVAPEPIPRNPIAEAPHGAEFSHGKNPVNTRGKRDAVSALLSPNGSKALRTREVSGRRYGGAGDEEGGEGGC